MTGTTVAAITAGSHFTLALTSDGSITAWGADSAGQATGPTASGVVRIDASYDNSLLLHHPVGPTS
ncbi:RCC1-like domain-containing protein [Plantactinospora sp. WMMC1484]|uniref:RCC1-like domain-containing protein n=1 Tax=Plantactinospora sp. WMMC1484 TaxID=3404122 RepID=UPI003BF51039